MAVQRITANIATQSVESLAKFYRDLFDLEPVMDLGWITTLSSKTEAAVQISFAVQGGSGTEVPDLSIEVDDVDATYQRATIMGLVIEYGLVEEPWGVRRFFLRDPAGKLLNILSHT